MGFLKDIFVPWLEKNVFSLHFYEMRIQIQILQIKAINDFELTERWNFVL